MAATQQGYLVLADISGFTSYLAGVELDHAHEILSDLLETIVNNFRPLLTLSKLEGDAVFVYTPAERISRGETLLELLEVTYLVFRNRIESIQRRTTCTCNACRAIPSLDLKFIAHYGSYILQQVAGGTELLGSDVNLVHRLLKNHVSEATGWSAYALFSQSCLEHMAVWPEGMHKETESYEHLGDIETHSLNLHTRYQEMQDAHRVMVSEAEAIIIYHRTYPIPPAVLWSWLNDMNKRGQWNQGTTWRTGKRARGRTGVGTRNHCAHGKGETLENILDWRPFDYVTAEQIVSEKLDLRLFMTHRLVANRETQETELHVFARADSPRLPKVVTRLLCKLMFKMFKVEETYDELARLIAVETAGQESTLFMVAAPAG